MRRRSFFLLEVLIAVMLIGGFAYLSIHGAFKLIGKQKQMLNLLQGSMEADVKRMKLIELCWNKVETLAKKETIEGFEVKSKVAKEGKSYLLKVKDKKSGETFSYFVTKHTL
jgi:hypothetical protein